MIGTLIAETTVAVFAVFGAVCAVRAFAELLFPIPAIAVAVELCGDEDADRLAMLLHDARSAYFRKRRTRVVVLIPRGITRGGKLPGDLERVIDAYGAERVFLGSETNERKERTDGGRGSEFHAGTNGNGRTGNDPPFRQY